MIKLTNGSSPSLGKVSRIKLLFHYLVAIGLPSRAEGLVLEQHKSSVLGYEAGLAKDLSLTPISLYNWLPTKG